MTAKVTQSMVAKAAGVDSSTVCLALNNSPKLPVDTKEKIVAVAKKLGYRRDPMMSALSAYRRSRNKPAFHGVLGWIVSSEAGFDWRAPPEYRQYFSGAKERAAKLGYQIALLDLNDYRDNPRRLSGVIRARSIRGVLVCPQPHPHTLLDLELDNLSAVTFGYTVQSPRLHLATSHHFSAMREVTQQLRARGYQRIGYAIPESHNDRLDGTYMAAFLLERSGWAPANRITPFVGEPREVPFRAWLNAAKPDAVIIPHYVFPGLIQSLRGSDPEKLGVAVISVVESVRHFSGYDEDSAEVGRVAVGLLASMVERGEVGVPDRPQRVLVPGIWNEGSTLRARRP